jgi:4-diphosphocytidyl-2-C-methyl-D-erythritol kinase
MALTRQSFCKVNLLLNILRRRADGFHELETVMQPVPLCDQLEFEVSGQDLRLTCNQPELPVDSRNLVWRAARAFLDAARLDVGLAIHLDKRLPLAAGLGGGSANAATTLLALNELFGQPLRPSSLVGLAAGLGSDVPFFLQNGPALATGRGEVIERLASFPALRGRWILLIHPGFGVATAWAYRELSRFPQALQGRPGRARELVAALQSSDASAAARCLHNSLEAPVLEKFPVLRLYQDYLRAQGAEAALMSGSGSTTFAILPHAEAGVRLMSGFRAQFGEAAWIALVALEA